MLPHWKMPIQCFWPIQNAVTFSQATISASTIRKTNFLVPPKICQSLKLSPVCVQRCVSVCVCVSLLTVRYMRDVSLSILLTGLQPHLAHKQ